MTQPATSNEATDLIHYLTEQRKHVLGILENLPEEAMRGDRIAHQCVGGQCDAGGAAVLAVWAWSCLDC